MKQTGRLLARLLLLAAAATIFAGLAALWAGSIPSGNPRLELRARRHRPSEPQLRRLPGYAGELLLVSGIAFAGRKVLRLRL
jgi:hypothetical protein